MEALDDVVRAGKARYLGASSMWTWQFAQMQHAADLNGWTRFVSMQDQYSLIMREEEREMLPYCLDQGVGTLPWSPLARGRLTRDWDDDDARSENDKFGGTLYQQAEDADRQRGGGGRRGGEERGVSQGAGGAGVAAAQAGGDGPDRRRDQADTTSTTRSRPST